MENYSFTQQVQIIEFYFGHRKSTIQTQRAYYARHFNVRNAPSEAMIRPVNDLPRSGRLRSTRSQDNIGRVRQSVVDNPKTSTRRRAVKLGLNRRSLQRILKADLLFYPYKI
nr:unnamed protein product [Callosobruchus chinensis]